MFYSVLYSTASKHFLACIDKFSKFAKVQQIRFHAIISMIKLLKMYPKTKAIYCDNKKSLNS